MRRLPVLLLALIHVLVCARAAPVRNGTRSTWNASKTGSGESGSVVLAGMDVEKALPAILMLCVVAGVALLGATSTGNACAEPELGGEESSPRPRELRDATRTPTPSPAE